MPSDEHARRTTHEFARVARQEAPLSVELDESDLYALQQGKTLAEVVKTSSSALTEGDLDTWADYLEIEWYSVGTANQDIRDACPDVFEGVVDE